MTPPTIASARRVPFWAILGVTLTGVLAYVAWFAWSLEHGDYNAWGTLLIGPALLLVSVPLLRRAVRLETDARIAKLIVVAFFVKLAAAFVNHAVAFVVYGGIADASGYHNRGAAYARAFRSGRFELAEQGEAGRRFIDALTGFVYTATGPSKLGGYLIFAWLGFWGLYLFYRAFVLAMPEGDKRRYAVLVFLLPSTLFWTSAIGKEAWMTLALGMSALGAARLLTRRRGGLIILSLGLAGSALCRPHIGLMVFIALLAGYLLRRSSTSSRLGPLATLAGLVVLLGVGSVMASQFASTFDLKSLDAESLQSTLDETERLSGEGGSSFTTSELPWPLALPGVLVRPYPFEAHNLQTLASSLEGTGILVLVVVSRRRLRAAMKRVFRDPYLMFCAVYSLIFVLAFSVFRNFGLLARERVQVFPFLLVLLALPAARRVPRIPRFGLPPFGGDADPQATDRRTLVPR